VTAAVLTPFTTASAVELGNRIWRKRVLPVGDVEYRGRLLHFTRDYLGQLVAAFRNRAYDQVPFQLADSANTHTNDPERTRGEITAMELGDDGLYITAELTPEGEKVLAANPKLGVSARIVEDYARSDGKHYPAAVQHVLGTLDPRIPGLGAWQAIEAASPVPDTVIDLSASTFAEDDMPGDGEIIELDWAKWDAEHGSGGGSASQKAHDTASATAKATAKRHMASKAARKNAASSVRGFKPKSASQLKSGHSIVWGNRKTGALEEHKVVSTSRKANGHVRVTLKGPDGKLHVTSMPPTSQVSFRGAPGDTSLPQVLKQGGFAGNTPSGNPYGLANDSTRAALELAIGVLTAAAEEEESPEGTDAMPDLDALTDEQKARLAALLDLPDEQLDALAEGGLVLTPEELLALTGSADTADADEDEDEEAEGGDEDEDDLAMEIASMSDEEFAAMQAAFETEQQEEPVAAGLSAEAQFAIDLATARAEETQREMAVISARLREQDYQAEKRKLADLGVPPFITELARPLLEGIGRTVELANGRTADAGQVMRKVLTEYAQQVKLLDLDVELGSPMDEPDDAGAEAAGRGREDLVTRFRQMTGLK